MVPIPTSLEEGTASYFVFKPYLCVSQFCGLLIYFSHRGSEEWVRPVMKRDKQVLLHWGYFPDRLVLSLQNNNRCLIVVKAARSVSLASSYFLEHSLHTEIPYLRYLFKPKLVISLDL